MSTIRFEQATCIFPGSDQAALDHLDLEIRDGELLVLVGPPHCGKTTALRVIAGLEDLTSGRVRIGEADITRVPPKDRDVAMVFQNYALYPHLLVGDNMGFPLKISGLPPEEVRSRVEEAAETLGLTELLDEKPSALTSTQRQQVALGRAVVRRPRAFLMDEPLVSLEPSIRAQTREQIVQLQKKLGVTTVFATADQVEAMTMADRVAVLDAGRLLQLGTPREVYDAPASARVAELIGLPPMNLLRLPVRDGSAVLGGWQLPVEVEAEEVQLGVWPEDLQATDPDQSTNDGLPGVVTEVFRTEAGDYVRATVDSLPESVLARATTSADVGARVRLVPDPDHVHLFSVTDGRRL